MQWSAKRVTRSVMIEDITFQKLTSKDFGKTINPSHDNFTERTIGRDRL